MPKRINRAGDGSYEVRCLLSNLTDRGNRVPPQIKQRTPRLQGINWAVQRVCLIIPGASVAGRFRRSSAGIYESERVIHSVTVQVPTLWTLRIASRERLVCLHKPPQPWHMMPGSETIQPTGQLRSRQLRISILAREQNTDCRRTASAQVFLRGRPPAHASRDISPNGM